MSVGYEVKLRIPFHDLDPMHVVWHGNYLKYFDIARFALFRQMGVDLYDYSITHNIIFPVIRSSTKHIVPLRHGDDVRCNATVMEAEYKIVMNFEIRKAENGEICTRGRSEQVAVSLPEMEMLFEIPEDVRSALGF